MANSKWWLYGLLLFSPAVLVAQSQETTGWIFLSHTQQLTRKWNVLFDAQTRSTDKLSHVATLLLRSALSYNISKKHSAALGYAFKGDWEHSMKGSEYQPEHRVYEQYLFSEEIAKMELTARVRVEQRFISEGSSSLFSQRARGFLALQIPLFANSDFSKGPYLNLQDELFLNVQHKENVNNDLFDQNRVLGSAGYRFSKHLDAELGLMLWRQHEPDPDGYGTTKVVQLMITTKL